MLFPPNSGTQSGICTFRWLSTSITAFIPLTTPEIIPFINPMMPLTIGRKAFLMPSHTEINPFLILSSHTVIFVQIAVKPFNMPSMIFLPQPSATRLGLCMSKASAIPSSIGLKMFLYIQSQMPFITLQMPLSRPVMS